MALPHSPTFGRPAPLGRSGWARPAPPAPADPVAARRDAQTFSKNTLSHALIWGAVLTGLSAVIPYHYCEGGNAWGLPFAIYSPGCNATFTAITLGPDPLTAFVLDLGKLVANILLWGILAAGARSFFLRRA